MPMNSLRAALAVMLALGTPVLAETEIDAYGLGPNPPVPEQWTKIDEDISIRAQVVFDATGALAEVVQTPEVRAELVAYAPQGVASGRPLELGLLLQHQAGWHTYWKNPGDSGLPTELRWALPQGMQAGPLLWPTPSKIRLGRLANFGYEGTVLLPASVRIGSDFRPVPGAGDTVLRLSASWLVCRTECIPQEGEFALRLPVQGSTALHGALFEAARAAGAPCGHAPVRS